MTNGLSIEKKPKTEKDLSAVSLGQKSWKSRKKGKDKKAIAEMMSKVRKGIKLTNA